MKNVRVTSYNILSSHLSAADYFSTLNPQWLNPVYRLKKIKEKIDIDVNENAIICLQEVSTLWAGSFHQYFSSRGYYFTTGLYGNKFNGYMGVGIAVPLSQYEINDIDITRISDTKRFPRKSELSFINKIINLWIKDPIKKILKMLNLWNESPDPWMLADKFNQMVCIRLTPKFSELLNESKNEAIMIDTSDKAETLKQPLKQNKSFVIGTYHLPCMFKVPSVMMIHCALASQYIAKYAKNDPYIFTGDFNIKPTDIMYQLLTQGNVEKNNPAIPSNREGDAWECTVKPMKSAYKEYLGKEPDFTNWSKVKDGPEFIDTLDYIFLSNNDWIVEDVKKLPSRNDKSLAGPYPNQDEPSDHLAISSTLSLK